MNCYHKIGSECIGFYQYIALEANAMVADLTSCHFSMSHQKCVWKNIIGRREVFHGGPLGLEIDNNIKNMPVLTAGCFMIPAALFLLHPELAGVSEDLS
jgi:hypothetical protein